MLLFKLIEPTPVFSVSTAYEAANYRATPTFAQLPAAAAGRSLDSGSMRFLGCHQGRTRRVHSQRHHAHHLKRPVEREIVRASGDGKEVLVPWSGRYAT